MPKHSNSGLWGIIARFTSDRENDIIREIFINNQTMVAVARDEGVSIDRIRQIKEKGLRKLQWNISLYVGQRYRQSMKNEKADRSHV